MAITLSDNYHGLNLKAIATVIDQTFGFPSDWQSVPGPDGGCYEFEGRIVVDLAELDKLCEHVDAGPPDRGHVFRYALAHLKAHHYQELHPATYDKSYAEDIRPYEIEADLISGWICANAQIPNAFRTFGMAPAFNDFGRLHLMEGRTDRNHGSEPLAYPWPEERELAFRRGARMWASGQITHYNAAAMKQGMMDETFQEFISEVPGIVTGMWNRPVPKDVLDSSGARQTGYLENRVPVSSGPGRS